MMLFDMTVNNNAFDHSKCKKSTSHSRFTFECISSTSIMNNKVLL